MLFQYVSKAKGEGNSQVAHMPCTCSPGAETSGAKCFFVILQSTTSLKNFLLAIVTDNLRGCIGGQSDVISKQ